MWQEIEEFIKRKEFKLSEPDYNYMLLKLMPKIHQWAMIAHQRAFNNGVFIDATDFFSYFQETVWQCIQSYVDLRGTSYHLSHIISHRIKLAEAMVWRSYRNPGTNNDKNHVQYKAGQLLPLNLDLAGSYPVFAYFKFISQLKAFEKKRPADAAVIRLLLAGYKPKEISQIFFNTSEYTPKYRKRINRIRDEFAEYIHS